MVRFALFTACVWIAGLCLGSGLSRADTRIGVITAETSETAAVMPLVEVALSKHPGVVLVDRNAIKEVLREQKLQAVLAAGAPGKRAALGKMLKADLLVFLTGSDEPKPHVTVVVCETQQGLRLCSDRVLLSGNADADVDGIVTHIKASARKRREKDADIVAVPPLTNHSLTHEGDEFQRGFARLVEQALLRCPGVLVVELAEAQALAQEILLSGSAGVERRLPLYLIGEYRFEGAGKGQRGRFSWTLRRGERELDRRRESDLSIEKMPQRLRQAALEMVGKALNKSPAPSDPQAEARQLCERARGFLELGIWDEAVAMAEASLILVPDQPQAHGYALRALNAMADELDTFNGGAVTEETCRAVACMRAALPHLEGFCRGTEMSYDKHHWCLNQAPWLGFTFRMRDPAGPEQHRLFSELYREVMRMADRVLAAKSAAKVQDHSLYFLAGFTEFPGSPEYGTDQAAWLQRELPAMCQKRLQRLEDFTWLKSRHSGFETLISIRRDAVTESIRTVYFEFLAKVEKLPNPEMQALAQRWRKDVTHFLQRPLVKPAKEAPRKVATPLDSGEGAGREVVYSEFTLNRPDPDGTARLFRRPIAQWFPIGAETDLVVSTPEHFLKPPPHTGDINRDFVVREGEVFRVREKGEIRRINVGREPIVDYPGKGTSTVACYDGRYVWWAVSTYESCLLIVVDRDLSHWWRFMPEDGVPPFDEGIRMCPLAPGKVLLAGSFGRSWCAIATFDGPARKSIKVFHEARRAKDPGHPPTKAEAADVAFRAAGAFSLSGHDDSRPARAVVFRDLMNDALLIDTEKPSVTGVIKTTGAQSPFVHEGALYFQSRSGKRNGQSLYCLAPPDFVPKEVSPDVPRGKTLFHQGRFYVWDGMERLWYCAAKPAGPYRALRGRAPDNAAHARAALSSHYGVVLFGEKGFYRVELPGFAGDEVGKTPSERAGK